MRYSDSELFEVSDYELNILKKSESFNNFCTWAIVRMTILIEESVQDSDWMEASKWHLRKYRQKAIKFYEEKRGE